MQPGCESEGSQSRPQRVQVSGNRRAYNKAMQSKTAASLGISSTKPASSQRAAASHPQGPQSPQTETYLLRAVSPPPVPPPSKMPVTIRKKLPRAGGGKGRSQSAAMLGSSSARVGGSARVQPAAVLDFGSDNLDPAGPVRPPAAVVFSSDPDGPVRPPAAVAFSSDDHEGPPAAVAFSSDDDPEGPPAAVAFSSDDPDGPVRPPAAVVFSSSDHLGPDTDGPVRPPAFFSDDPDPDPEGPVCLPAAVAFSSDDDPDPVPDGPFSLPAAPSFSSSDDPDPDGLVRPPADVDYEVFRFKDADEVFRFKEVEYNELRLGGNDPTPKLKALSTLAMVFLQNPGEEVVQIVPQWACEYKLLLLDYNKDVRRATNDTMSSLVTAVKKGLAPHLKSLMGPWWFSLFDPAAEVALAARRSFEAVFPQPDIRMDALMLCVKETFLYLNENLKLTPEALFDKVTPMDEVEDMHQRVISSSLLAMKSLIAIILSVKLQSDGGDSATEIENHSKVRSATLSSAEAALSMHKYFLGFLRSESAVIRSATYTLLSNYVKYVPHVFNEEAMKILSSTLLGAFNEKDPLCHSAMWDTVLVFSRRFPEAWSYCNVHKVVLNRFCQFLQNGCYGSKHTSYPLVVQFLDSIPPKEVAAEQFSFEEFLKNLWAGRNQRQLSAADSLAFFTAFKQSFLWLLKNVPRKSVGDSSDHIRDRLITNVLVKMVWQDYLQLSLSKNLDVVPSSLSEEATTDDHQLSHKKSLLAANVRHPTYYYQDLGKCIAEIGVSVTESHLLVMKLAELHKEIYNKSSKSASELEDVIRALQAQLTQVEKDYKEKLEKETLASSSLEKVMKLAELDKEIYNKSSKNDRELELEDVIRALQAQLTQVEKDYKEKLEKETLASSSLEKMAKDEEISRLTCENLELHDYKDKAAKLAATSERCAIDLASSQAETCQLRTQAMSKDEEIKRLKCDNLKLHDYYKAKAAELERCAVDLTSSQAEIRQLRTQAMAKDEEIKRLKRENLELHDYSGTQEAEVNLSPDLTNTMTQESESAPATRKKKEDWTPEEVANLREGVAAQSANGNKKWIKLLEQGKDIYHPSRRPCDLGRKWRYMEGKEKKKKACAASKSATAKRKEDPATSKPPPAKKRKRSSTTAKPSSANKRKKGHPTAKQSSAKISRR